MLLAAYLACRGWLAPVTTGSGSRTNGDNLRGSGPVILGARSCSVQSVGGRRWGLLTGRRPGDLYPEPCPVTAAVSTLPPTACTRSAIPDSP
ncbi:MAG TPA: hypothetical protein VIU11_17435 [Nakamurella sp.]